MYAYLNPAINDQVDIIILIYKNCISIPNEVLELTLTKMKQVYQLCE